MTTNVEKMALDLLRAVVVARIASTGDETKVVDGRDEALVAGDAVVVVQRVVLDIDAMVSDTRTTVTAGRREVLDGGIEGSGEATVRPDEERVPSIGERVVVNSGFPGQTGRLRAWTRGGPRWSARGRGRMAELRAWAPG
jgi:hypothetical protein